MDTVNGFAHLIKQFKDQTCFIVWLNPYWGAITYEGKSFEELKAYKDNAHYLSALVRLPDLKKETFGFDLESMLKERLTFGEAIASPSRNIMAKQRLKLIQDNLFTQLNTIGLI